MEKIFSLTVRSVTRGRGVCAAISAPSTRRLHNDRPTLNGHFGSVPESVRANVKNVQGWRGGAERGFLAVYPDLVHTISRKGFQNYDQLSGWYTKVLTHNLSKDVLGQRYGILVPITYKQLCPLADRHDMELAHILGWGVELVRASDTVARDAIWPDRAFETSWSRKHDRGTKAFNDALLLQNGIHMMLQSYFAEDPDYKYFLDAYLQAFGKISAGRALVFDGEFKSGVKHLDMKLYKTLLRNSVVNVSYCLPVSLAMYKAGLREQFLHDQAHRILIEIGYTNEVTRDFSRCFLGGETKDIEEGRLTWLVVLARQRANSVQMDRLERCYGKGDREMAEEVKRIYTELKLEKTYAAHMEEKRTDILSRIQQISKIDAFGLTQEFFFKLMDTMEPQ